MDNDGFVFGDHQSSKNESASPLNAGKSFGNQEIMGDSTPAKTCPMEPSGTSGDSFQWPGSVNLEAGEHSSPMDADGLRYSCEPPRQSCTSVQSDGDAGILTDQFIRTQRLRFFDPKVATVDFKTDEVIDPPEMDTGSSKMSPDSDAQTSQESASQLSGTARKVRKVSTATSKMARTTGIQQKFSSQLSKLLHTQHIPSIQADGHSIAQVNFFVNHMFEEIARKAQNLMRLSNRKTLSLRDVEAAVKLCLNGQLRIEAQRKGEAAIRNLKRNLEEDAQGDANL